MDELELLRRRVLELERQLEDARATRLRLGALNICRLERTVTRNGKPLHLLPREFMLLVALALRAGELVAKQDLDRVISAGSGPGANALAVHVSRLRSKLTGSDVQIVTERGRGYSLIGRAIDHL